MESCKKKLKHNYSELVPAAEQATRILGYLSLHAGFKTTLKDICTNVGIHKSKGYALLNTLQKAGYVNKEEKTKLYSLGFGLIALGQKALDSFHFRETARPFLEDLAKQTHGTAMFGVIASDQLVIVGREDSEYDAGVKLRLGHTSPLTYAAAGKAIVAFLPEQERNEILSKDNLFFHGEPCNLDREKLKKELLQCRHTKYAEATGRAGPLVKILASPVLGPNGYSMGALVIVSIFPRAAIPSYGGRLAEAARQLSTLMGCDVTWPSMKAIEHAARVHGKTFVDTESSTAVHPIVKQARERRRRTE